MTRIKNFKSLILTRERKAALEIIEAGLKTIDPEKVVGQEVKLKDKTLIIQNKKFSLKNINRLFLVGIGKCALEASQALEKVLGNLITGGMVVDIHKGKLKKLKVYQGSHPIPSLKNINATEKIIKLLAELTEKDLVIFVISGGGSTLLSQPTNFTYQEEARLLTCLFEVGATIKEINTIRKHLSLARGGYLAKYAYPAKVISLIFSDVPGDSLEFIASGPTVKDSSTIIDARRIIKKYSLQNRCQLPADALVETPKEDKYFKRVRNILLVNNKKALKAMAQKAKSLGFKAKIVTAQLKGEARQIGVKIIQDLKKAAPSTVLLYGGETTVTLLGKGKGGRNQELALAALNYIQPNYLIVAFASDGKDNTNFAGAICDIITKEKAKKLNLKISDYLARNDSYNFFAKTKDFILTGDTGANVSDLIVAIKT